MAPPVAILLETRMLPSPLPAMGDILCVQVWRRDGWYAYRASLMDENGATFVDIDSGACWFVSADRAVDAAQVELRRRFEP